MDDPSDLNCDECFAVMEYYAEVMSMGSSDRLPVVVEHLKECTDCELQHREALRRLLAGQSKRSSAEPMIDSPRRSGS